MKTIYLGAGCFWGTQEYFRRLKGVLETEVGYGQGHQARPTYQEVCTDTTGHVEMVRVVFDESVLSLNQVIDHFMRIVDPTTLNRQGNDIGTQYRSGVYVCDHSVDEVKALIHRYADQYLQPLVVEIEPLTSFYPAETYHQDYLLKNPTGYCHVDFSKIRPEELK